MSRWRNRYLRSRFFPRIKEHDIVNEYKNGKEFVEIQCILVDDIDKKYRESFNSWAVENGSVFTVEKKIREKNGKKIEDIEKKAVNVIHWEKWYNNIGIRIR